MTSFVDDLIDRYPEGASEAEKERIDSERFEAALKGKHELDVLTLCQDIYDPYMRKLPRFERAVIGSFADVFQVPCPASTLLSNLQGNDEIASAVESLVQKGVLRRSENGDLALSDERLWKWLVFKTRAFIKAFHTAQEKNEILTVTEFLAQKSAITAVQQSVGGQVQAV